MSSYLVSDLINKATAVDGVHKSDVRSSMGYALGKLFNKARNNAVLGAPFALQTAAGKVSPILGMATGATYGTLLSLLGGAAYNWRNGEESPFSMDWRVPALGAALGAAGGYIQGANNQPTPMGTPTLDGGRAGMVNAGGSWQKRHWSTEEPHVATEKPASVRGFSPMYKEAGMGLLGTGAVASLVHMIASDPQASQQLKQILTSIVGQLPDSTAANLNKVVGMAGGAGVAFLVAKYLMNAGIGTSLLVAALGGTLGGSVFDNTPRASTGLPLANSTYF